MTPEEEQDIRKRHSRTRINRRTGHTWCTFCRQSNPCEANLLLAVIDELRETVRSALVD